MSLKQNGKKIKLFYICLLLVAIGLFTFLIIQISHLNQSHNFYNKSIDITKSQKVQNLAMSKDSKTQKTFYIAASTGGTKYYYQNCSGLKRIKPENLIYFTSESLAEGAGYTLAKNCKKP